MNAEELEREKQRKIERAEAYKQLMQLWAFKDFLNELKLKRKSFSKLIDDVTLDINAPMVIAEARGSRRALAWIEDHLDYIINGSI